jgi:hypothetical protein
MRSVPPHGPSVEVLVSEGCPNTALALERVQEAARIMGVKELRPKVVRIRDTAEAVAARFLGSPSVRVNGRDVELDAQGRSDFGLNCRLYRLGAGVDRAPPVSLIVAALARARSGRIDR